ncbi:hypothetical protein [Polynucleobacter sp.]|uniref:hypothetical protein n=1 Tax=Polynucleobacter sp. TaxID=2029855 RepID=UPI0037C87EA4
MSGSSGEDSSVWQGYVAAVASLAQAMLFLMAVLVIALMQVSAEIDMSSNALMKKSKGEKPPAPAASKAAAPKKAEGALTQTKLAGEPSALYKLIFSEKIVALSREESADLRRLIEERQGGLKGGLWDIFAITDIADSEAKRLAYLRVVEVRNLLIQRGIPASSIQTSLKPGVGDASKVNAVYINWTARQEGQTQ